MKSFVTLCVFLFVFSLHAQALIPFSFWKSQNAGVAVDLITIMSATYGGACGVPVGNYTAEIGGLCNGTANCPFNPSSFGDPAFGCAKDMLIHYTCGTSPRAYYGSAPSEGDQFISCPPKALLSADAITVTSATYGASCGASTDNWMTYLSGCNGYSSCPFNPIAFGDPAPACAKDLVVKYQCGGVQQPDYSVAAEASGHRIIGCGAQRLVFLTPGQNVSRGQCSSYVNIESQDALGNAFPAGSNVTVDLTSTPTAGLQFFSDEDCQFPITQTTIYAGQSQSTIYFSNLQTGTKAISLAATGYNADSQYEAIVANTFAWTGSAGDGLWSTAGNWSGGVVPGISDRAVFDGSLCGGACNATIDTNIDIGGLYLLNNYAGVLTQNAGVTILLHGKWIQEGGTFIGSDADIGIWGRFVLAGGNFTSTSGTLTYLSNFSFLNSTVFNHHNGIFKNYCGDWSQCIITPGTAVFNDVSFYTSAWGETQMNGSFSTIMHISGDLIIEGGGYAFEYGVLEVAGDVIALNQGKDGGVLIKLVGNPLGQKITGTGADSFPNIEIDTGLNPVTLSGTIAAARDFKITSVGTFTTAGATLKLQPGGWTPAHFTPGTVFYNNLIFAPADSSSLVLGGGTANVSGTLTFSSTTGNGPSSGTVHAYGNVISNGLYANDLTLVFVGTSAATLTSSPGAVLPVLLTTISKTGGGSVTLASDVILNESGQSVEITSGSLIMAGYNLTIDTALTLNSNVITKAGGVLTVGGITAGTGSLFGGTVNP